MPSKIPHSHFKTTTTAMSAAGSLVRRCFIASSHPSASSPRPHTISVSCRLRSRSASSHVSQYLAPFPDLAPSSSLLPPAGDTDEDADPVWASLRLEAELDVASEPALSSLYNSVILSHSSLESSLSSYLAAKLCSLHVTCQTLTSLLLHVLRNDPEIGRSIRSDLMAARDRDPACSRMVHCFLHYKGFLALQTHRVAHSLWAEDRRALALFLQGRASEVFSVDIHPGARVGAGILLDHATGVVIGETAVVGDHVSILHNVTLGGTGKEGGDRHPKLGDGVLVGAGSHILGNVRVGEGAKVGAGSVVLKEVPPGRTAVGNPARVVGSRNEGIPAGLTMDHTSWSDYVI